MKCKTVSLGELVVNFDRIRVPLSSRERSARQGIYPYYGATSIMGYVDDYLFDGRYILFGEDGTVIDEFGKPILQIASGKFWCNNHAHILQNSSKVDFDYLYYLLKNTSVSSIVTGAVQPKISQTNMNGLKVDFIEDIVYQKKVATILKTLDDKIDTNNAINQNLEEQASTLIEDYFYCTQAHSKLSNLMNFENGFPFSSKSYLSEGRYRIVTIKNVQDGKIDMSGAACVNILPPKIKEGCLLKIGDVLLSLTGNVGRVGIVCEQNLLLNQRVAKVTPYDATMLPFLYFTLRQPNMKKQMEIIAKGTAQLNLSPVEALQLDIPYKDVSAQRMSETLSPMYRTITYNNQENITLEALREAILPKLMSGELDVSELDI